MAAVAVDMVAAEADVEVRLYTVIILLLLKSQLLVDIGRCVDF